MNVPVTLVVPATLIVLASPASVVQVNAPAAIVKLPSIVVFASKKAFTLAWFNLTFWKLPDVPLKSQVVVACVFISKSI